MNITPLNDKIVVRRDEPGNKTKGGIVLPDNAKDKPKTGKVLAVGQGRLLDDGTRVKIAVEEGDRVLFTTYAGHDVDLGGEEFLVIREDDILAVIS